MHLLYVRLYEQIMPLSVYLCARCLHISLTHFQFCMCLNTLHGIFFKTVLCSAAVCASRTNYQTFGKACYKNRMVKYHQPTGQVNKISHKETIVPFSNALKTFSVSNYWSVTICLLFVVSKKFKLTHQFYLCDSFL